MKELHRDRSDDSVGPSMFDSFDWSEESSRELERIGQTGQQNHICLTVEDEVGITVYALHFSFSIECIIIII